MRFFYTKTGDEGLARGQERAMTRKEIIRKALQGEITWIVAAEVLRLTPRQVRRVRKRYESQGEAGLLDQRLGKKAPRKLTPEVRLKILTLYRERYRDFSALHFFEKLTGEHQLRAVSYTAIKNLLQEEGLLERHARRSAHRKRRERRPMKGMLLHLDGSTHAWLGENYPNFDLLAVMDDATSEVYSAEFVAQEGTRSCMGVLRETVEKHGVFCSLYTDRAMHFVVTLKAGDKPDRTRPTQISRAFDRLGIELIHAYSPQARGRSERLWRTWQGRLPQELRVASITGLKDANRYLKDVFLPWHNANLTVLAQDSAGSAFVPCPASVDLQQVFSIQSSRQVNSDNTVQYKNLILQIEAQSSVRYSFAGVKVKVHEHDDGTLSITYGPHTLGRYTANGEVLKLADPKPMKEPDAKKAA